MKLSQIEADEKLKEATLNKAKNGKPALKIAIPVIAAALVLVIGASLILPGVISTEKSNVKKESNEAEDIELYSMTSEIEENTAEVPDRFLADKSTYSGEPEPEPGARWDAPASAPKTDANGQGGSEHMTAAKLDDNLLFDEWLKTAKDATSVINNGYSTLALSTEKRITVTVSDNDGNPSNGQVVQLLDKQNNVISTSVTGKNGKAYLYYSWLKNEDGMPGKISVNSQTVEELKNLTDEVTVKADRGYTQKNLDVMFMIDSTGSMGDEMNYLANELSSLLTGLSIKSRISVNFYRDEGDEYVTKTTDFTDDINTAIGILKAEKASGGGDYAEAVDKALEKVASASWNGENEKICFLVLDAPAHSNDGAVRTRIANAIKVFEEKGIRIVPVIASSADFETEITMRQIAMLTNGEYVFITNHSGIGGDHIEATTEAEYDVKPLIQILNDVINDYV